MGEIVLIGPEAAAALDYALAGKLSAIEVGQAKYSLLLAEDGGIIDDLVVYRTGDDRYMVVANASNAGVVADELRSRADGFDTFVSDESDDVALVALQGPDARAVLLETPGFGIDGPGNDAEDFDAAIGALKYYRAFPRPSRATTCSSPAPATRAKTGSSCTSRPTAPPACGRRCARRADPASCRAGSRAATPCVSRRVCRCTATS